MKANILVVDDDSKIIKVIKDFLEMENYNIYVAEDGKTALALLGKKIDLIIFQIFSVRLMHSLNYLHLYV